eukprot:5042802-Prymnesium_polylepis.1
MSWVEPEAFKARAVLLSQWRGARTRGEEMTESSQVWLNRLLDTFEIGEAAPVQRTLGAWNAAAGARGAHIVTYLEGDKRCVSSGGEAAYLLKPGLSDE